jgi:FHA domain
MPTCPLGHDSTAPDFCHVCGMRMGAAPSAATSQAPSVSAPASAGSAPNVAGQPCPQCGGVRSGRFCEVCGFDSATAPASTATPGSTSAPASTTTPASTSAPASATTPGSTSAPGLDGAPRAARAPSATGTLGLGEPSGPAGPAPVPGRRTSVPGFRVAAEWTAVVTADRAYFDSVIVAGGPDAATLEFPAYCPERRFRLAGPEMRIGRRSVSRGLAPEIDLTGPPLDPGVSHMHAVLIVDADGSWAALDPGSSNGTQVNGVDITSGVRVPLRDGDRVCVGAWTVLTIHAA